MPGPISPHTRSRLLLPRNALVSCLRGAFWRDTLGAALDDAQRFNHFPGGPLCSLTWVFEGRLELLPPGVMDGLAHPREPLPAQPVFGGPGTRPLVSWSEGPVQALMLLILPDAMHRLTGLAIDDWVDRWAPAAQVLPPEWQALCDGVQAAADDVDARFAMIQEFVEPRWASLRPARPLQAHRYLDWAHALALHAATSATGRSLRQVERRIKRWAGLPLRELRGMGRSEQAFFAALAHAESVGAQAPPNWAELADAQGYADQSHLCRETRRMTGFSPDELYRRIREDESFWTYRLWG